MTALLRDVKWIASSVKADWKMVCCICQITKWIASSARSSSAIERSEQLVNKIYFTLPSLSALVREAYNVTCLERSKQFGKKDCTQFRLNDCLATWRELHRPVYAARNVRSSEHVCCICQRIVAEWLSSCIYQFNVLCFTPLQYHKCLQYKICYAVRVVTPARCSDVLFVRLIDARRNWACGTAIPLTLTV